MHDIYISQTRKEIYPNIWNESEREKDIIDISSEKKKERKILYSLILYS